MFCSTDRPSKYDGSGSNEVTISVKTEQELPADSAPQITQPESKDQLSTGKKKTRNEFIGIDCEVPTDGFIEAVVYTDAVNRCLTGPPVSVPIGNSQFDALDASGGDPCSCDCCDSCQCCDSCDFCDSCGCDSCDVCNSCDCGDLACDCGDCNISWHECVWTTHNIKTIE